MAKLSNARRLKSSCQNGRKNPCQSVLGFKKVMKHVNKKKHCITLEKKDWKGATCSVCMEFPHNAVLLLCSSYNKGCRPYMCATSNRFSNCLDQYKKAYTRHTSVQSVKPFSASEEPFGSCGENVEVAELLCPLCRGQVKGWTVIAPAREHLNKKKRTCVLDNCSFVGNYKQLRKHVKSKHPFSRPREVDPVLEQKWKVLERERERRDVISTITSSMPGAIIAGDYVIEPYDDDFYSDSDSELDDYEDLAPLGRLGSHNLAGLLNRASRRGSHFHVGGRRVHRREDISLMVGRDGRPSRDRYRRLLVQRLESRGHWR